MEGNKQIVKDFFDAFLYNDKSRLKLAEDFIHESPAGRYEGREEFLEHCWPLAEITNEYINMQLIAEGDTVCAKYDFPSKEGEPPASVMEWHTVKDGEIKEAKVVFDTARFKEE